jgi:GAF domain-containing protein
VVGNVMIFRQEKRLFSEKQIALLKQFAAQAVIAIENTWLLRELRASTEDLRESLQQQTATADVLKVISRSAFDLQTVLDTLVTSAAKLCGAGQSMLTLLDGGVLKPLSYFGPHPEKFEVRKSLATAPHRGTMTGRAILDRKVAHAADVLIDPEHTSCAWQQLTGFRAVFAVPLMLEGQPIGAMMLSRTTPGPFAERQIELVQTFADQAVIAIQNAPLLDEVQVRTKELPGGGVPYRAAQDVSAQSRRPQSNYRSGSPALDRFRTFRSRRVRGNERVAGGGSAGHARAWPNRLHGVAE